MGMFDKLKPKKENKTSSELNTCTPTNSEKLAYGFEYGQRVVFIEGSKYEPLSDYGIRLGASCLTWRTFTREQVEDAGFLPYFKKKYGDKEVYKVIFPELTRTKDISKFYVVQSILLDYANPPLSPQKIEEGKKNLEKWKKEFDLTDDDIKNAEEEITKNIKLINGEDYIFIE